MKHKLFLASIVFLFAATYACCSPAEAATSFSNDLSLGQINSADVTELQTLLAAQGLYSGPITGNFFNLTKQAVIAFQKQNGISPTGYVGPVTRSALNELVETISPNSTSSSAPASSQASVSQNQTGLTFDAYPQGTVAQYSNNPSLFLNSDISIKNATADNFFPAGNQGSTNSYIEITNYSTGMEKMMLETYNSDDYTKITAAINKGDFLIAYGVGSESQSFGPYNSDESYNTLEPVILVQRIDKCDPYDCSAGHTTTVFDRTGATSISTVVPPQTMATLAGTPSGGTNSTSTTQILLSNFLTKDYNNAGNSIDLVNALNGSYSSTTIDYFSGQLQTYSNNAEAATSYLSTVVGYYEDLLTAATDMSAVIATTNNNLDGYISSPDLTPNQQNDISDLNNFVLSKSSEYGTKVQTVTNTLNTYKNMLNEQTSTGQSLYTAASDLSNSQNDFIQDRNTLLQKIQAALNDF